MKNVTITLEERVAAWIRVEAAKAGKSVSRYIGDRLAEDMRQGADRLAALDRFLSGPGWRCDDASCQTAWSQGSGNMR